MDWEAAWILDVSGSIFSPNQSLRGLLVLSTNLTGPEPLLSCAPSQVAALTPPVTSAIEGMKSLDRAMNGKPPNYDTITNGGETG